MTYEIAVGPNVRKSPYFDATVEDGVRAFAVYNHMFLPAHYGDPDGEYDRLIEGVAMWDVAVQRQVQLEGPDAARLAQVLTPRDIAGMEPGQGRYVPLCDHDGWLINDPVLLKLADDRFWLSIADSDIGLWATAIGRERGLDVRVSEPDVAPLAVQGPKAEDVVAALLGEAVREIRPFRFEPRELDGIPLLLARSGWSKQGGFELYLTDTRRALALWARVREAGQPFGIGPGAPNDVERIESGLISYGADMRRQTHPATPYEMGFGGMVDLGHDFIGRDALAPLADQTPPRRRVGVVVEGDPPTPGHPVPLERDGAEVGFVSELVYSKRLGRTIAVGLLQSGVEDGLSVRVGETLYPAHLHEVPFL
ncbi:aminomethyl transferase family protein [Oceanicola granulosus HTCC2516]|uniref:Aminomethyl transferase family protein n=1 Tax=Oceanicola granulosus (strain ATCC BAA-861 / DSM 15982 / KCTC 12143 / HTCC2516) TaxID=314256 RepID=Q2CJN4_OCEGH|nr:glycine cleavage T C-terminal barrel domain-containing protein [Oceanicola granulosus]EAR53105.1 aminomethyl transferase family protein [Oceanicola granulosus HTCC2516]